LFELTTGLEEMVTVFEEGSTKAILKMICVERLVVMPEI